MNYAELMENVSSFSEQFRGPDARLEEMLRASAGVAVQHNIRLVSYKFHRIKLRDKSREPFHLEFWVAIEEIKDRVFPMGENFVR